MPQSIPKNGPYGVSDALYEEPGSLLLLPSILRPFFLIRSQLGFPFSSHWNGRSSLPSGLFHTGRSLWVVPISFTWWMPSNPSGLTWNLILLGACWAFPVLDGKSPLTSSAIALITVYCHCLLSSLSPLEDCTHLPESCIHSSSEMDWSLWKVCDSDGRRGGPLRLS